MCRAKGDGKKIPHPKCNTTHGLTLLLLPLAADLFLLKKKKKAGGAIQNSFTQLEWLSG